MRAGAICGWHNRERPTEHEPHAPVYGTRGTSCRSRPAATTLLESDFTTGMAIDTPICSILFAILE